jgi:hypothetical protein
MFLAGAKDFCLLQKAHTGSGSNAASCSLGTRITQIKKLNNTVIRHEDDEM